MKLNQIIHWPRFLLGLAVAMALALVAFWLGGVGFWVALTIGVCATLVNGILATIEDQLPGGFENPEPRDERKNGK
jgi:hypothetical protein